jgi:pimeloyl-ACP methyl ester carboxylesterase
MWRWTKRILKILLAALVVAVVVGTAIEFFMRWRTARLYPVAGQLVDVGGRRIQMDCRGKGAPTVVFEAGLDTLGSLSWSAVHDRIAAGTRACAYSRAGILWSDASTGTFDVEAMARDLHAALAGAGERPPYVLVAQSLGGPYAMVFTAMYQPEVVGLVFVDTTHPDQIDRITRAVGKAPYDLAQQQQMLSVISALAWTGLLRLLPGESHDGMPAHAKAAADAYASASIRSASRELNGLVHTLAVSGRFRTLADRPLVVLTAAKPRPVEEIAAAGLTPEAVKRYSQEWTALQDDEAHWSTQGRHESVADSAHYIQFERPEIVIAAIQEVVAKVRRAGDTKGSDTQ